jgi:hypothetical protein
MLLCAGVIAAETVWSLMRKYEPIWIKLKQKGVASITAHPLLHKRIIKAVIKEKWLDIGYKLEIQPRHSIMTHTRTGSILEFKLTKYLGTVGEDDV